MNYSENWKLLGLILKSNLKKNIKRWNFENKKILNPIFNNSYGFIKL